MTVSARVKQGILEVTEDGKPCSLTNMKERLRDEKQLVYGADYSDGHFSGAVFSLEKAGKLLKVDRGVYRNIEGKKGIKLLEKEKPGNAEEECKAPDLSRIQKEFFSMVGQDYEKIERLMKYINPVELKPDDMEFLGKMIAYKAMLEEISGEKG